MNITDEIIQKSVRQICFGTREPFISCDSERVDRFYDEVFASLAAEPGIDVHREADHYGSGYASYVSAFLFRSDGKYCRDVGEFIEKTGILLYMSRLAPIAVFGASARVDRKGDIRGSPGMVCSSGFIDADTVGILPDGDWHDFLLVVRDCLRAFGIEFLERDPLLSPAPTDVDIPTVFDGPYFVFDTFFYWCD